MKRNLQHLSIILHVVSKNNMWASHGLDRFCVRPYFKLGPELQVRVREGLGVGISLSYKWKQIGVFFGRIVHGYELFST